MEVKNIIDSYLLSYRNGGCCYIAYYLRLRQEIGQCVTNCVCVCVCVHLSVLVRACASTSASVRMRAGVRVLCPECLKIDKADNWFQYRLLVLLIYYFKVPYVV